MARRPSLALALLLAAGALSGCFGAYDEYESFDPDVEYKNPGVFPGTYLFSSPSHVLVPGLYDVGEPEVVQLRSTLPAYDPKAESLSEATVLIVMAIWRPQNLTEPVPIIIDAGPYYEVFEHCKVKGQRPCRAGTENDTIDFPGQSTQLGLENFLPHGYAIVQLAVRGTGTAGGCMDLLGPSEVHDLDQAVTWLAEQPWSNGNIAMIGTSYDGSTPWEVAATGNPALKTIVPISGLPDIYDLMFHNGSAESRGPIMHDAVYWGFGFDDDFGRTPQPPVPPTEPPLPVPALPGVVLGQANGREDYQNVQNLVCPEVYEGGALGYYTYATGARGGEFSSYWTERDHRQAVLDNYKGSIFLIHGLQDWNVDPHSAIPFNAQLRAKGIEMKEWYGQWDHNTPDGSCSGRSEAWVTLPCRLDWAEVLLRWFDRYLKGNTTNDVGPPVQVQDDIGYWRNAEAFPPTAPLWTDLPINADGTFTAGSSTIDLMPGTQATPGTVLELRGDILTEDLRFSGMPQLKLPFEAQGPGGQIAVWLFDEDAEGNVRAQAGNCDARGQCEPGPVGQFPVPAIAHGQLNLRYYAGGEEPQNLVTGTRYVAQMELEPLEVMIPRGHRLVAWIFQGQGADHLATATPSPVRLVLDGDAVLRLPVVDVDPTTIFPVPGIHTPDRELYGRMHVLRPQFAPTDAVTPPPVPIPVIENMPVKGGSAACAVPGANGFCGS
ncbi:MAG: X-Pro dipeptidyl-peptidase [Thermoplasmata archaeon]|nr:X-Pro dipeptidyl-peptidase [Thermoplasmata archaeon]